MLSVSACEYICSTLGLVKDGHTTTPCLVGAGDTPSFKSGNCGEGGEVFANKGNLEQG